MEIDNYEKIKGKIVVKRLTIGGTGGSEQIPTLEQKSTIPLGKKRILLVDDDYTVIEALRASLEEAGYSVQWGTDAAMAKFVALDWKPDLLITDVAMPGMDGFTLVEEIFNSSRARKVPVLFISAMASQNFYPEPNKVPYRFSLLKKPFDEFELLRLVQELLSV